jgi:hypothetical protein
MKKIRVFLDDIRTPEMSHNSIKGLGLDYSQTDNWVIVRDYFEFVKMINNNFDKIELVSFDHDLACLDKDGLEWTGKDAADYLINYCLDNLKILPDWYVHTDNTSGRQNIIGAITGYLKVIEGKDLNDFRYYHNGIVNYKFV